KGRVLVSLGRVERAHGQYERALAFYERAYALQQGVHDEPAAIQSLNAIAVAYGYMGRMEEARQRYEQALARAPVLGPGSFIAFLTGNLAGCLGEMGRYQESIDLLQQALAMERTNTNRIYRYLQLADSLASLGRMDEALTEVDKAAPLAEAERTPELMIRVRTLRASIDQHLNRLDASDADLAQALHLVEELRRRTVPQDFMKRGFSEYTQEWFNVAIDARAQRGDARAALEYAEQARARALLDLLASR